MLVRARIQGTRAQGTSQSLLSLTVANILSLSAGAKMVFVVLRQQAQTMQGLVLVEPEIVSKKMVRWVEGLHDESIVLVEAVVAKAKEPIKSCTHHNIELKIKKVRFASSSLARQRPD